MATKLTNLLSTRSPLKCETCESTFEDHFSLAYHSKSHHKAFACHICDFKCTLKNKIRSHIRQHSGYQCQVCDMLFKKPGPALIHSYVHGAEKNFQCQACGSGFLSPKHLQAHIYKVHKRKLMVKPPTVYECGKCNKKYGSRDTLRRHFSSNHQEMGVDMSLMCEVCGKRMETRTSYKIHMRIHTGQKPYKCNICDRSFAVKCRLTTHIRTHTGEKPYECSFCGKKFGQHAPYWYHTKTHTGDRKHACKVCGKRFISHSNMNLHVKTCFSEQKG